MQSEAELQSVVLKLLKAAGVLHFRVPVGSVLHGGIRKRSPLKGFPDIAGYCRNGRGWTMELKSEDGKLREEQQEWHAKLQASNVWAFIIRSEDAAVAAIHKILNSAV